MKTLLNNLFFVLIIFVALFLRLYRLDSLPISLNPDEAALGYTAFSFLETGKDEHGVLLPLSIESFGDWKLPTYSYIDVIPVKLFGLNEFSTRFPSALAGVVGVACIYFITFNLFAKKQLATIASLFYAVSPWNIYFSRAAYEVNLAVALFLTGFVFLLQFFRKSKIYYLAISYFFFIITMFTYHSFIFFMPLFVLSTLFIFKDKIIFSKSVFFVIFIFFLSALVSYINISTHGGNKISTLFIFNDKNTIYNRSEILRGDNADKNLMIEKLLHTKYAGVPYQIVQNYVNSFSPSFLFDKGGEKLVHNIGSFGFLYLIDVLFLSIGLIYLFWNREKGLLFLIPWLLIAPIPSSLTRDAPNATRLFLLMPLFTIIAAYGAYNIFYKLTTKHTLLDFSLRTLTLMLFIINFIFFWDAYFVHFNYQRARFWHFGSREVVQLSKRYPDKAVVMRGPENFPYIYFLFYLQYNPGKFQKEVKYYPYTDEGFLFIKEFGKHSFLRDISYSNLKKNTIYIDDLGLENKGNVIRLPSGDPVFQYTIN